MAQVTTMYGNEGRVLVTDSKLKTPDPFASVELVPMDVAGQEVPQMAVMMEDESGERHFVGAVHLRLDDVHRARAAVGIRAGFVAHLQSVGGDQPGGHRHVWDAAEFRGHDGGVPDDARAAPAGSGPGRPDPRTTGRRRGARAQHVVIDPPS